MGGETAIAVARPARSLLTRAVFAGAVMVLCLVVFGPPATAEAGQASSGELLFYPCDSCHPVSPGQESGGSTGALPIDFEGHAIVLEGHDALGEGGEACLTCHGDPAEDPGMLKLADGSLVDITGDISQVCYRCHYDKYEEFEVGDHGHMRSSCTDAGCHDPHSPGYIYAEPLFPFVGTGFQFKILSEREPFSPLAPPPPPPAAVTPTWFVVVAMLGFAMAGGLAVQLVRGRQKR